MPSLKSSPVASFILGALVVYLPGCASQSASYPFRPSDSDQAASTAPPGVRYAAKLRGVVELPTKGIPSRQYELTLEVEQPEGPKGTVWEPVELNNAKVVDDESREFHASDVFISKASSKKTSAAPSRRTTRHYLVTFELGPTYRFESIGHAHIRWKLRAAGQRPIEIRSNFLR
ncbi:MAG: hypothetical protein VX951_04080 [Planctomycetota bacterium]|nr:hypothetical protein [Planctomycetota bacterium]